MTAPVTALHPRPTLRSSALECFLVSLRLGLTSFGGPIAHLGYFEQVFVQKRGWLTAEAFAGLVGLCQVLPGPASSQVNFLVGWMRAGFSGACLSWLGFTLPSALLLFVAALFLPQLAGQAALLHGLKLVAAIIVAQAVWNMAPKLCPDGQRRLIAFIVFVICVMLGGIYIQLAVLAFGAAAGGCLCRRAVLPVLALPCDISAKVAVRALMVFALLLIALPVVSAFALRGEAFFTADVFYRAGALVFGGGHVVLPLLYDTLQGVVPAEQFMALYGAAQAVPGPLFTIAAGLGAVVMPLYPATGAVLAALFVFLPGLLLAIAGLYFWQRLSTVQTAAPVLAGLNAAVVGLLAGALVDPVLISAYQTPADAAFMVLVFAGVLRYRLSPVLVVVLCLLYAYSRAVMTGGF